MKNNKLLIPKSSVYGIGWPALPGHSAAAMLAMQYQLEQSQWLPSEVLMQQQFHQLDRILSHAIETVPFYQRHFQEVGFDLKGGISPELFTQLPLLRRSDIQSSGDTLLSRQVPKDHGRLFVYQTSGSSGKPIKTIGTNVTQFFWNAFTLREHIWHKRNLKGKLASIRTTVKDGIAQGWGPSTDVAFNTGICAMLNIRADIDTQINWIVEQNPDYLLSHPSNIRALAQRCISKHIKISNLCEVRTFGETVSPDLRAVCLEAWGAPIVDTYSAQEIGYIALQCPETEHYHIQSENVFVEILNEYGHPCEHGEIGQVVVTTLHNFAMPLIRYEILDYAEVGKTCSCGRGLAVLRRILGRQRNMITFPDGKQHWPSFPAESWAYIAPIRQIQLVQRQLDNIVTRIVADRPLNPEQEHQLTAVLQKRLGYPFHITYEYPEQIDRNASYKYEDFVSELSV